MKDLTDPRLIKLKGGLFLFAGLVAAALLVLENPTLKTAFLVAIAVWCFCRAYYFAFYVIEHYVDPGSTFPASVPLSGICSENRAKLPNPEPRRFRIVDFQPSGLTRHTR